MLGGVKTHHMKSTVLVMTSSIVLSSAFGQDGSNCVQTAPELSAAYQQFLGSDLLAQWSTSAFGPFTPVHGGEFHECTTQAGDRGFSMLLSQGSGTVRTVGYASRNGQNKALVFDVSETATNSYRAVAYDVSGTPMLQIEVVDGTVVQALPVGGTKTGCTGIALTGLVETAAATATGGLLGFGIGMGIMMFNLWDNDCL
jgi:hypothetical protein